MAVLSRIKDMWIVMTEPTNTYVQTEMSDGERDAILKSDETYKELKKADSNIEPNAKSVLIPVNSNANSNSKAEAEEKETTTRSSTKSKKGGFVESVDVKNIEIPPKMVETYKKINQERVE